MTPSTNEQSKDGGQTTQMKLSSSSSLSTSSSNSSLVLRPPFPPILRRMLSKCRLTYLSTVEVIIPDESSKNHNSTNKDEPISHNHERMMLSSHLSLMRFTYLQDDPCGGCDVIILSTNRKTKKYDILLRHKEVALLVHDFYQFDDESQRKVQESDGPCTEQDTSVLNFASRSNNCSITLNGECHILADDDIRSKRYREAHLQHNLDYPQFIVGDDIAILYINVTSARICNIKDQVTKWSIHDSNETS